MVPMLHYTEGGTLLMYSGAEESNDSSKMQLCWLYIKQAGGRVSQRGRARDKTDERINIHMEKG